MCSGGFIVTIPNRLLLYIGEITALSRPLNPLPAPLKAIARGFVVLFHTDIWSPSTIFPHLNLFHLPSLPIVPHPAPISQCCLSLLMSKLMFKGVSQWIPTLRVLYTGLFDPSHYSSLPLYLPPPIFQQLSIHILTSSTCTDVMCYDIVDALSFPFPFPPSSSSIDQFHCFMHVLHLSLCLIMFVLAYMRNMFSFT
jgi:hypothetical protein